MPRFRLASLLASYLACTLLLASAATLLWSQDDDNEIVVDPYCGMKLAKKDMPFQWVYQGETYFFCMELCKNEFMGDPKKFTGAMASTREVLGHQLTFIAKPRKPMAGTTARLILEFLAPEAGAKDSPKEAEVKLVYNVTVGGSAKKFEDTRKLKAYKETGVFGTDIKAPGKGYCDATFTVTFASGTKKSETFKVEILPSPEEDTGNEYDGLRFDMIVQHQSMRKLGEYWWDLHETLWSGAPDFDRASKDLAKIEGYSKLLPKFHPHKHADAKEEWDKLTKEYMAVFAGFKSAMSAKDAAASRKAFDDMEANHCTKCHLKFRWDVVQDMSRFPDLSAQPGTGGDDD